MKDVYIAFRQVLHKPIFKCLYILIMHSHGSSRILLSLKPSEESLGSQSGRVSQTDLEIAIQIEQIINILNTALHKLELVLCLPMLIENDGEMLRQYLTKGELAFVLETCEVYVASEEVSEASSEKESEFTQEMGEGESNVEGKRKTASSTMQKERADVNMWKVIRLLWGKPPLRAEIKELLCEVSPAAMTFLDYYKELQVYAMVRLTTSAYRQQIKDQDLRRVWNCNEHYKELIRELTQKQDEQSGQLRLKIAAKTLLVKHREGMIKKLNDKLLIDMRKRVYVSERRMITDWKDSENRQDSLSKEIREFEAKLDATVNANLKEEKELRAKRLKAETQLLSWLNKYDADIGEKQAEYDEMLRGFNEEKEQMEELQEKFAIQNEQYEELMAEKEAEEQRIFDDKFYAFLCNRSARRIQRAWRAYKAYKLARRKSRKQKKGKKGDGGGKKKDGGGKKKSGGAKKKKK